MRTYSSFFCISRWFLATMVALLWTLSLPLVCHAFVVPSSLSSSKSSTISTTTTSTSTTTSLEARKIAVIAGATGYIGKAVVQDSVRQGYDTYALVRDASQLQTEEGRKSFAEAFQGANIVECNVCDQEALTKTFETISQQSEEGKIDLIVSCLASRSGLKKDAYQIDYQATLHCLRSGQATNARHFVLLSAFCVKNPWLKFQQAKLKFEAKLQEQTDMTWTIVRPTAFFKSVSGQVEVVRSGAPYLMFGNGKITRCNPIAESDLAHYLVSSATESSRSNKIVNLGGPDNPLTQQMQGEMIFRAVGMDPCYLQFPVWIFDAVIDSLQWLADLTGNEALEDAAETGRIGKYYAVEDMLTTHPEEKFGTITLEEHYNKIAQQGVDYDPYVMEIAQQRAGLLRMLKFMAV